MLPLLLLAFLGGALTILSPCILPVLPFVFARADKPFLKNGLPMLVGMGVTFAAVATLAAVVGGWAVQLNQYGRVAALVLLALFGAALLFPALADRLTRPLVALGGRLSEKPGSGFGSSLLLGVATGLLWAPCAGPILGLIFTGAALNGASAATSLLLLAYALGAAASLALALLVGGRVYAAMKRSIGAGEWVRRGLGVLVLGAVVAIALGIDTGLLTRVSATSTARLEQGLLQKLDMGTAAKPVAASRDARVGNLGSMPPLDGAVAWLNSPPLTREDLKGKVVLIDFWTYSCINCIRTIPFVEAWYRRYAHEGLVIIGVHTPEFAFEKRRANVEKAIREFGITYPVAMDDNYAIWKAFKNSSWPAHYFIDAKGQIRSITLGEETDPTPSEAVIRKLLAERNGAPVTGQLVGRNGSGRQAKADIDNMLSQETYLGGFRISDAFASPGGPKKGVAATYAYPAKFGPDQWAMQGRWRIDNGNVTALEAGGRIAFSFQARDLHMVLGPSKDGKPIRFRVRIDGHAPGADHGLDLTATGGGIIREQRLYQLIRQAKVTGVEHRFEIEFLDPGVEAYTFTFG